MFYTQTHSAVLAVLSLYRHTSWQIKHPWVIRGFASSLVAKLSLTRKRTRNHSFPKTDKLNRLTNHGVEWSAESTILQYTAWWSLETLTERLQYTRYKGNWSVPQLFFPSVTWRCSLFSTAALISSLFSSSLHSPTVALFYLQVLCFLLVCHRFLLLPPSSLIITLLCFLFSSPFVRQLPGAKRSLSLRSSSLNLATSFNSLHCPPTARFALHSFLPRPVYKFLSLTSLLPQPLLCPFACSCTVHSLVFFLLHSSFTGSFHVLTVFPPLHSSPTSPFLVSPPIQCIYF